MEQIIKGIDTHNIGFMRDEFTGKYFISFDIYGGELWGVDNATEIDLEQIEQFYQIFGQVLLLENARNNTV
jgi:hypothetical protein